MNDNLKEETIRSLSNPAGLLVLNSLDNTKMPVLDGMKKLDAIHRLATSALQTSWLYAGKDHVEKLMREIAAICQRS